MKLIKAFIYGSLTVFAVNISGCKSILEPEEFTQIVPDNLFSSLEGVESVLFGAYAQSAEMQGSNVAAEHLTIEESMADLTYAISVPVNLFREYILTGDGSASYARMWNGPYAAIRNCNILLENIDDAQIDDATKGLIQAEATFIRAIAYFRLYMRFGPVPLRTQTSQELELPKAAEAELLNFIETELNASIPGLPNPGQEPAYGRAHKAAAIGFLMKLHMATKQWQKAADAAQQIMDMGVFGLFPDYLKLFWVENERNEELVWVRPAKADIDREAALTIMAFAYPPNFQRDPRTGLEFVGSNFGGSNVMVYDEFYDSFHPDDKRKDAIITTYIATNGSTIDLSAMPDSRRPFKFWPDADVIGSAYGNDLPEIRYADVLLSRAEALNELQGANQESIDLINQVRDRAAVPAIDLAEFDSTEELRDYVLMERGWELYLEGHRRHDLIRHGKLIERAQARGLPAQPHHVRLPIPVFALDANPNLVPTDGYK